MKKIFYIHLILLTLTACSDVLDKSSLTSITDDQAWNDPNLADSYLAKIALDNSPGWGTAEKHCDEATAGNNFGVSYGLITSGDLQGLAYWPYANIRSINIVFEKLSASSLSESQKNLLEGQAHFWRAYVYFEMVKRYGGVPIIKDVQKLSNDIFVARNKTSECFDFIIDELDKAITMLPVTFTGNETGKINRAVAFALKGRILLYKASPQFNPSDNAALWTDAYNANKAANDSLLMYGYGLYDNFSNFWFNEMNKEVVFVTRFNNPERTTGASNDRRPTSEGMFISGGAGGSPVQELVDAFPMIDGTPIVGHSGYDPQKYWENRDPRFDATIVYNGKIWELSGKTGRIQWTYNGYNPDGYGTSFGTLSGYYTCKAVELAPTAATAVSGGVDWVEIRFAEVMMNYAEAANETGHTDVAYEVLKQIRKRAGLIPGVNDMYGLTEGQNKVEMRETLMKERLIEFAYENKRFWDLRRLRWLNRLTGTQRHGLHSIPIDPNDISKGFTLEGFIVDTQQAMNFPDNYYFLPMTKSEMDKNPNLKQTDGWDEGGFNPLQ
ncbi:MAG: RagB/SusD family nutrient uptake outer membrane protein [Tannerella sp.]|jgi:hypothetical protein|nr:RagB/SusD family nutrient uptake outer membrane protein [Tannerella sp.]